VMAKLTEAEREVLEMVAGARAWVSWGAWLGACLDSLKDSGLITTYVGTMPRITEAGRAALSDEVTR